LQTLQERLRPYEEYERQARDAVSQLSEVQRLLRNTGSPVMAINRLLEDGATQSATIEALDERLAKLEDGAK